MDFFIGTDDAALNGAIPADARGVHHPPAGPGARIVSLVPSITELLIDLGLTPQLVGRTGFCVHPREAVRRIPKVGGTKGFDLAKLRALAPTHVIANMDENRAEEIEALADFVPHVVITHPNAPGDNRSLYALLGALFDRRPQAAALTAQLEGALADLAGLALPRERVLYLIWRDPWLTVARNTYIGATLAAAGWDTVPACQGGATGADRYPAVDLAAAAAQAERILLPSEPYHFGAAEQDELQQRFPQVAVTRIDGEMVSWYGSRAPRGLTYLAQLRRALALPARA